MAMWILTCEEDGLTALEMLQRRIPAAPRGYLRQLLRSGKIHMDSTPVAPADTIRAGSRLNLPESGRLKQLLETATDHQTSILFESREILVVYKPAGIAVHRGAGYEADNLADRVNHFLKLRKEPFRSAPAHRLDVETSGPVIFGKGRSATSRLGKLFMAGEIDKIYLALVIGEPAPQGVLSTPVPMRGKLKAARTRYRTLQTARGFALIELYPESGRKHQIRRQLAALGHPVAGDRRYGGSIPPELTRLFLHCSHLQMIDPFEGGPLAIDSPLPADLKVTLDALGFSLPQKS